MSINVKMTALADSIRAKSGEHGPLGLDDMKVAVDSIEASSGSEAVYYAEGSGTPYLKNTTLRPSSASNIPALLYNGAENIETLSIVTADNSQLNATSGTSAGAGLVNNCSILTDLNIENGVKAAVNLIQNCHSLENVVLGGIQKPCSPSSNWTSFYFRETQAYFYLTIYVDADSLDNLPAYFTANQPWGATNATIIYRSSATGEVLI